MNLRETPFSIPTLLVEREHPLFHLDLEYLTVHDQIEVETHLCKNDEKKTKPSDIVNIKSQYPWMPEVQCFFFLSGIFVSKTAMSRTSCASMILSMLIT